MSNPRTRQAKHFHCRVPGYIYSATAVLHLYNCVLLRARGLRPQHRFNVQLCWNVACLLNVYENGAGHRAMGI